MAIVQRKLGFVAIVPAVLLFCSGMGYAVTIWYVDADAPAGGDGTSWATAFDTIQEAIDAVWGPWVVCTAPNHQIWVRKGTYTLTSQINVNAVVSLYGGFDGSETSLSQRDWESNTTTIHGNDSVRCLNITSYCVINGFTIRDGNATTGAGINIDGVLIHCTMGGGYMSPAISNCTIRNNVASTAGGGIYILDSDPTISNCIFSSNESDTGGAIYHLTSSPTIRQCIFRNNESTAPGSLGGGAIGGFSRNFTSGTLITITNCLFYNNTSGSWGGAISYNQVYPTITNCTISSNTADIAGGAFHGNSHSEAPKIHNTICWGNSPDELDIVTSNTYLDVSYCDIEGGWTGAGSNNIDADPDFSGTTNFRLTLSSPCIDTASNGYGPDEDLENRSRPRDGDSDGTATCDMGAYEFTRGDFRADGIVDLEDFAVFAAAWDTSIGEPHWNARCDISVPRDNKIKLSDFVVFAMQWLVGAE
ncbi:MAG: right-handed parallel beta-helix repeat-containing protein [Phycisphaerae bacterium]|nr:right-handed parallel beta-helix repeat-containing protein [Phycisphaerae bacterium]